MAAKFTEEQLKAIETTDRSVLVSAAAGSGKTAVLVERIIRIILAGKANVDEMLVVTFTNAAAAEMRLRLSKALRRRMEEHPEDAARMKDQLSRLYRAYISTIDSFALRVIREFFHEVDMEPNFTIADEVQSELLRRDAVSELFDEAFENDDLIEGGSFRAFLRLYSDERTDEHFTDSMLDAYSRLRSMPDYFEWAYGMAEQLKTDKESFEGSSLQAAMLSDARETFGNACDAMRRVRGLFEDAGLGDMYEDKLRPQEDALFDITAELSGGRLDAGILKAADSIPSATLRAKKAQKEAYEIIKDDVKALREIIKKEISGFKSRYLTPDLDTRIAEMNATYEYTVYYLRLLEEFERRYDEKKREKRLMDFADSEHCAVRILKSGEAAGILRRRFKYIFVDEYQDTNNIQERLISSIARPDNVFRVGDLKQSIYRFRQAEPEIFERLYAEYTGGSRAGAVGSSGSNERPDEADSDHACLHAGAGDVKLPGIAIDLGRNFRTNSRTINYINHVFSNIMEGYDERAMLYAGLETPEAYDFMPEVHVLFEESGSSVGADSPAEQASSDDSSDRDTGSSDGPDAGFSDDDAEALSKEEAEAKYIASLAASIIGTEFYDSKAGVIRRAEARDIVILFRAVRYRGEVMSRALREISIEPHIEETEDYFDTVEINTALSLLSCIDNMKRDLPLISVLHSEVFNFNPEELATIRMEHSRQHTERCAYHAAFEWFAAEGPDGPLKERASAAREKLLEWRRLSRMLPLEDFVWKVLVDSGYYRMAGAMSDGARRQANLRTLADRAAGFSKDGIASLTSFISFLAMLRKRKIKSGQTPLAGRDDNVVRISTIHKSKGLEYPFVIVGGLGHRFREDSNEKGFSFDSSAGVGLSYVDPSRKYWRSTMIQRAINSKSRRDGYREELRLLYVAMTRARNRLYMVGTAKSEENLAKYEARPGNFLKAMSPVLKSGFNIYKASPLELTEIRSSDASSGQPGSLPDERPLDSGEQALYEEIDRRFSYRYPDEGLLTAKAKFSVSEIRRRELEEKAAAADGGNTAVNDAAAASGNVAATAGDLSGPAAAIEGGRPADEPHEGAVRTLSVKPAYGPADGSDVQPGDGASDEIQGIRRSLNNKKKASSADIGIAYHRIMEFLDFTRVSDEAGNIDEAYIAERAEFLRAHDAIDSDVYRHVDLKKIAAFFASDLGQRAAAAGRRGSLRREKPFTLKTVRGGREMLVQGVIDCCFEENGKMVLIDYKSSFIKPGRQHKAELARIREEYRIQIELYTEAVRKGCGMNVGEAYLWLFTTAEALSMTV